MITIGKPVYERLWNTEVVRILSNEDDTFTVQSVKTNEIWTHRTALDCYYLSFDPSNFSGNNDDCIKYLLELGVKYFNRLPSKFNEILYNTEVDLTKLLRLLHQVNNGKIPIKVGKENYIEINSQSLKELVNCACGALITLNGSCHWVNISKVRDSGFKVFPDEKDSFGWLTGCIKTNKGIIVYG